MFKVFPDDFSTNDLAAEIAALGSSPFTIYLRSNTYDVKATIVLTSHQELVGSGGAVLSFDLSGTDSVGGPGVRIADATRVRLAGLQISTTGQAALNLACAVQVSDATHVVLERLQFVGFAVVDYTQSGDYRGIADRAAASEAWRPAVRFEGASYYGVVRDCWFANNDVAVHLHAANQTRIEGGAITGGCVSGLYLEGVTSPVVHGVSFDATTLHAMVEGNGCAHASVSANRFESSALPRIVGKNWHLSFSPSCANNAVVSNPFVTSDVGTGAMLVRNPGATRTRTGVVPLPVGAGISATTNPGDLTPPMGRVWLSTSVPPDWDRQSPLTLRLGAPYLPPFTAALTVLVIFTAIRGDNGPMVMDHVATTTLTAASAGLQITTTELELPATAVEPEDGWLVFEVRGLSGSGGLVFAELRFGATDARIDPRATQ
jgi:hypothetical protein